MKKKRFFSRIFAVVLAAVIAAATMVTNSGMGLLVFATDDGETGDTTTEGSGSDATYSVRIISPDVPADKPYRYDFYQIIDGEVEEENGVNIIANPQWGAALGGEEFDNVPAGKVPVGEMEYNSTVGISSGYYPSSEVMLAALSGTMSCEALTADYNGRGSLLQTAYKKYSNILKSYGVNFSGDYAAKDTLNYFYAKFKHGGSYTESPYKTRDAKGLVELLNAGSIPGGTLKTPDLRAFADLLLNGVDVKIDLGIDEEGASKGTEDYTYKFITGESQAKVNVSSNDGKTEYTVGGLDPGYYLVACVDESNSLTTNNGYEASKPIKPVSTMLVLVGPANNGVAEIVGKNAYSVPTVTLDMYQKPVKLDYTMLTGYSTSYGIDGYNNGVENIAAIVEGDSEDNWKNTGSFDYYQPTERQEAILYRIGITLPMNFDSYAGSGYFLAVLDQYGDSGTTNAMTTKKLDRVYNVRPYVYVKHKENSNYELVGRYMGNQSDIAVGADGARDKIGTWYSSIGVTLTGNSSNIIYNENDDLGFHAHDLFCLGDLYGYTTGNGDGKCMFKPGDTIYIYYPAILNSFNVYNGQNYLLNANRIWAVYSNNPYADKLNYVKTGSNNYGFTHVQNNEVGVSPIAEANVNTYSVKLTVGGENGYTDGAKFALYREVGDKTREYAVTAVGIADSYVRRWIPESELMAGAQEGKTIEQVLLGYYNGTNGDGAYVASTVKGITAGGVTIRGLAAGEYYLQELTINSNGVVGTDNQNDPAHENIKNKHYVLAEKPIKFKVGNKYNQSVSGGYVSNSKKTFIDELTVDFFQETKERAIDTYIYKPNPGTDAEGKVIPVINDSITTALVETDSKYATEDGGIEIQVYHKTLNLIWLPETGGIGTTIFFIVGGTIVMAAVVMILTRFCVKRERL